jgi:enamine deaminase RidA (YjgF/YER057c/UK114 family)
VSALDPALEPVNPAAWKKPSGYSNGMLAPERARLLFVAGQVAWDAEHQIVGADDFAAQFRQALSNVVEVVRTAGGEPQHLGQLTIFVTDKRQYMEELRAIGAAYRDLVGRHFPAMALVEVADLLEEGALLEIQAMAAIPTEA